MRSTLEDVRSMEGLGLTRDELPMAAVQDVLQRGKREQKRAHGDSIGFA